MSSMISLKFLSMGAIAYVFAKRSIRMIEVEIKADVSKFEEDVNYKFISSICEEAGNSMQVSSAHQRILVVRSGGDRKEKKSGKKRNAQTIVN